MIKKLLSTLLILLIPLSVYSAEPKAKKVRIDDTEGRYTETNAEGAFDSKRTVYKNVEDQRAKLSKHYMDSFIKAQ